MRLVITGYKKDKVSDYPVHSTVHYTKSEWYSSNDLSMMLGREIEVRLTKSDYVKVENI